MNIVQIQNRVQELPNTPQTMQYLNAALNGQVKTIPPYIAAAELQRRESEGMADQLAKGAAQGPQPTVKDQLEEKMGIMALMGQQQPPQRPQIPQPAPAEPQPEAAGIDSLPVKDDMFGMAGGGIVAFQAGGASGSWGTNPMERQPGETADDYRLRLIKMAAEKNKRPTPVMSERAREAEKILLPNLNPQTRRGIVADTGGASMAEQDAINAALKAAGVTPGRMPPAAPTRAAGPARPPAAAKPPTDKPPTDKPPTDTLPGINLADLAPGAPPRTLESSLASDPAYQKMLAAMGVANPYAGKQETQQEYIDRMRQGILSQTGGKMPYETSEARLKELEGRRAKEDADYAEAKKGRQLDNLLTFIGGMGRGSFGNAGVQGINAVQRVERDQRAEDLRRQDLRDQQAMKLMEIRSLNDQAQFELAKGNVQNYEALMREAKKLQVDYDLKQADLAKGVSQAGESARKGDVEDRRARDVLAEESRRAREKLTEEAQQKALDRESSEKIARIQAAARQAGRGELTPAQLAKIMKDAEAAIAAREKNDTRLRMAYSKDPAARAAAVKAEEDRLLRRYTSGSPSPETPAGGNTRMRFDAQGNPIK
jgi:hypothetical protein